MGDEEHEAEAHICQHDNCNCLIRESDDEYCGAYCKTAAQGTDAACQCGHTECTEGNG